MNSQAKYTFLLCQGCLWCTTFTKGHIENLKELDDYRINGYLRIIESLNDEINAVSKKILLLAQEDEMAKLLMTVPGIGYYLALLIVSEVGDINRFPAREKKVPLMPLG